MCEEILNWIIVKELLTRVITNSMFFLLIFQDIDDSICKCSTSS